MVRTLRVSVLLCALALGLAADPLAPLPLLFNFSSAGLGSVQSRMFIQTPEVGGAQRFYVSDNGGLGLDLPTYQAQANLSAVYWGVTNVINANYAGMAVDIVSNSYWTVNGAGTSVPLTLAPATSYIRIWDSAARGSSAYFDLAFTLHELHVGATRIGADAIPTSGAVPTFDPAIGNGPGNVTSFADSGRSSSLSGYNQIRQQLAIAIQRQQARLAFVFSNGIERIASDTSLAAPFSMALYVTPEPSFYGLLGLGVSGLFAFAWRRRRSSQN